MASERAKRGLAIMVRLSAPAVRGLRRRQLMPDDRRLVMVRTLQGMLGTTRKIKQPSTRMPTSR